MSSNSTTGKTKNKDLKCGLVIPMSECDGCSFNHWNDVKEIIFESINSITEFKPSIDLVSEAKEIVVIHKTIVQNLYSKDIVICDISGKNPNVMLELGLRLAFDKPTIIVKDDKTQPPFDSSIIQYIPYPRSLHYLEITEFKKELAEKIVNTHRKKIENPEFSTFLKNFGEFKVVSIDEKVVKPEDYISDSISDLISEIRQLHIQVNRLEKPSIEKINIRNRVGSTDGMIKIMRFIKKFKINNPDIDPSEAIKKDEGFISHIEREIEARDYFNSRGEFRDALFTVLDLIDLYSN